jgi:peptidoglycan/LPS O-acetylase OafA/YrhL
MNPNSKNFFGGLESLRGLAALLVVFLHIKWTNSLTTLPFFRNGYLMVDLFFVLSGFVICHNYGQKIGNARDAGHFMFLRLGRLYPLHLFCLIAFLCIEIAKYIGELKFHLVPYASAAFSINNAPSFIAHLLLIQIFCPFAEYSFNGPSWSISAEFYTYLIFALVVWVFPKRKSVLIVSVFLVLISTFLMLFFGISGSTELTGWSFLRCILGFFMGVLAYHAYDRYHSHISRWSGRIAFCLPVFLVVFMSLKENPKLDGTIVLPVFFVLIIAIAAEPAGGRISRMLDYTPLRWLGRISYSIYMTHYMVLMFLSRCVNRAQNHFYPNDRNAIGLAFVFLAIAAVLFISRLTYQWIEKPFQNEFRKLSTKHFGGWQSPASF